MQGEEAAPAQAVQAFRAWVSFFPFCEAAQGPPKCTGSSTAIEPCSMLHDRFYSRDDREPGGPQQVWLNTVYRICGMGVDKKQSVFGGGKVRAHWKAPCALFCDSTRTVYSKLPIRPRRQDRFGGLSTLPRT